MTDDSVKTNPTMTKVENIDALLANLERLIDLSEQKVKTLREMHRVFSVARLVPEVMKTSFSMHVVPSNSTFAPWRGATLFVNLGEGRVRTFDLVKDNVPECLWPPDVLRAYQRHSAPRIK